jgi:hypothetical protein
MRCQFHFKINKNYFHLQIKLFTLTWRRTVEDEIASAGKTWDEASWLAQGKDSLVPYVPRGVRIKKDKKFTPSNRHYKIPTFVLTFNNFVYSLI